MSIAGRRPNERARQGHARRHRPAAADLSGLPAGRLGAGAVGGDGPDPGPARSAASLGGGRADRARLPDRGRGDRAVPPQGHRRRAVEAEHRPGHRRRLSAEPQPDLSGLHPDLPGHRPGDGRPGGPGPDPAVPDHGRSVRHRPRGAVSGGAVRGTLSGLQTLGPPMAVSDNDELRTLAAEELEAACSLSWTELSRITPWGDTYRGFAPS